MSVKKNPAAVALAKLRMSKLSDKELTALGRAGNAARNKALTAEQRREIARKAGKAGGRGRKKSKD